MAEGGGDEPAPSFSEGTDRTAPQRRCLAQPSSLHLAQAPAILTRGGCVCTRCWEPALRVGSHGDHLESSPPHPLEEATTSSMPRAHAVAARHARKRHAPPPHDLPGARGMPGLPAGGGARWEM